MRRHAPFSFVLLTIGSLLLAVASPAFAQDAAAAPAPAANAEAPAQKAWDYPREINAGGVRLAMHEPAVLDYVAQDGTTLLRVPLEITDAVGRVTWGAVEIAGRAHLDLGSRLVLVDGLAVAKSAFPELDAELSAKATEKLPGELPAELMLRLELFTDRPGAAPVDEAPTGRVSTRPPEIYVRRSPAVLVQIDGEPVMQPVDSPALEYVINSAADIFHDVRDDRWLLLIDGFWASAPKLIGPWEWFDGKLPIVLTQLKIDHPRGHIRRYVPGTKRYANRVDKSPPVRPEQMPEIIVSEKPAELVLLKGDPLFMLVPRIKLMTVANTASDLLFHPRTAKYFLLVSGRWFQSDEIDGPWAEHFGSLPDEFKLIPRDHGRAHVLWSVAGTPECAEAAARALLPERVLLHRRVQAGVRYEGKTSESSPVEGVEFRKVRNTEDDVFDLGGSFYVCVRGSWFRSDDGKNNWTAAVAMPEKLALVPESTGAYHVNACRPLGAAEKGFAFEVRGPYRGVYLHKGTPVYGNGWDTGGVMRNENWYPSARTYGENRWYDPLAGSFRPRSVTIDGDLAATAAEWSDYTASYGRVVFYADRYLQGGRRMFLYSAGKDEFDLSAPRPDIYTTWAEDVLERDGLPNERFPLGDRSAETTPDSPPVFADDTGHAYRLSAGGNIELYVKDSWIKPPKLDDKILPRLEALARTRARTEQLRKWAAQRSAALPVNPVVTPHE